MIKTAFVFGVGFVAGTAYGAITVSKHNPELINAIDRLVEELKKSADTIPGTAEEVTPGQDGPEEDAETVGNDPAQDPEEAAQERGEPTRDIDHDNAAPQGETPS